MQLADKANQYIDAKKPWQLAKEPGQLPEVQKICTTGLNLSRILMIYIKPIVPRLTKAVEQFLNTNELVWSDLNKPLIDHTISTFKPLLERLDKEKVAAMYNIESNASLESAASKSDETHADSYLKKNPLKPEITVDDF